MAKVNKKEEKKVEKAKTQVKEVVKVSEASDQTTTVAGIQANKAPKFGKKEFHV